MPSKKMSKGKARRNVAKDEDGGTEQGDDVATVAANSEPPLHSQMKGLNIDKAKDAQADDEDALLEEAIKIAAAEKEELEAAAEKKEEERLIQERATCKHGWDPSPSELGFCVKFMDEFMKSLYVAGDASLIDRLIKTDKEMTKKYSDVWKTDPNRRSISDLTVWELELWQLSMVTTMDVKLHAHVLLSPTISRRRLLMSEPSSSLDQRWLNYTTLMITHSFDSLERESHAPAWMRSTKKSDTLQKWERAGIHNAHYLIGCGLNAVAWCTALDAFMQIIALVNVKKLIGKGTRGSVEK